MTTFVDRVDFVTSIGYGSGPGDRERFGLTGAGPRHVITDLGILEPDPETRELTLTHLHPGATEERARGATGWPLAVAPGPDGKVSRTEPPSAAELAQLRRLAATLANGEAR